MKIHMALRDYLNKLQRLELEKVPPERRPVPTITDLANIARVNRVTMSNFANDKVKLVNLELLTVVLLELRKQGFETEISDLFTLY